ncbi:hypothetical protein D3C75_596890 [compost metagenome]
MVKHNAVRSRNDSGADSLRYRLAPGIGIADGDIHRAVSIAPPVPVEGGNGIFARLQREQIYQRIISGVGAVDPGLRFIRRNYRTSESFHAVISPRVGMSPYGIPG